MRITGSLPPIGWLIAVLFLAMGQACAVGGQETLQPQQVDQLVAPIALYPDPLIALVLPASADYSDIAAAAGFLQQYGGGAPVDGQPWDDSVKALAHYPVVVSWMAQNPPWTQTLGAAFLAQPADIIQSIQRLRAEARASGALVDSPQQVVVVDGDGNIEIEPAQTDVIYVPRYDPNVVYLNGVYDFGAGQYITYGDPYPTGIWLTFGFDWRHRAIWVGDWSTWHDSSGWRRPNFRSSGEGAGRRWAFPADRRRPSFPARGFSGGRPAAPARIGGEPPPPPRNGIRYPQGAIAAQPRANDGARRDQSVETGERQQFTRPAPEAPRGQGEAQGRKGPQGSVKKAEPSDHKEKKAPPPPEDRKGDQNR